MCGLGLLKARSRKAHAKREKIVVGGYSTHDAQRQKIDIKRLPGSKFELDRISAPWAFGRGEPFRAIASLELLGALVSIMTLIEEGESESRYNQGRALSVGAITDNLGNRFALAKLLTTKWPLSAFLAELACQLEARALLLEMHWVPREQNSEADSITNGDVHWLSADLEIKVDMASLPFAMLPQLLEQGEAFYQGIEAVNVADEVEAQVNRKPIKVRDPWDK